MQEGYVKAFVNLQEDLNNANRIIKISDLKKVRVKIHV